MDELDDILNDAFSAVLGPEWSETDRAAKLRKRPPIDQIVRRARDAGLSTAEAARAFNVPRMTIDSAARRMGVRLTPGKGRDSPRGKAMRALAAEGLTIRQAAERLGEPYKHVWQFARRNNISFAEARHD